MGKLKKKFFIKSLSPKQVHQHIMKSPLGKAIKLKKFESLGVMTPTVQQSFDSHLHRNLIYKEQTKEIEEMEHSKLDQSGLVLNDKSNKNLQFLPFMKERNGVGRLIDSDQEVQLKHRLVPTILETNRILMKVNKMKADAQIKVIEQPPSTDDSMQVELKKYNSQQTLQRQGTLSKDRVKEFEDNYKLKRKNTLTKPIILMNLPNLDNIQLSKIGGSQSSVLTPKGTDEEALNNRIQLKIQKNSNHQLPFQHFRVTKEKNFVFLNSLNVNKPSLNFKDISAIDSKGIKLKLRDHQKMILDNQPCLGTYNPNIEVTRKHRPLGILSFDLSHIDSKVDESKQTITTKKDKRLQTMTKLQKMLNDSMNQDRYAQEKEREKAQMAQLNKDRETKQQNQSKPKLLKIPLDDVFEQRSKIKTMIMDIKSSIYKIDKY